MHKDCRKQLCKTFKVCKTQVNTYARQSKSEKLLMLQMEDQIQKHVPLSLKGDTSKGKKLVSWAEGKIS